VIDPLEESSVESHRLTRSESPTPLVSDVLLGDRVRLHCADARSLVAFGGCTSCTGPEWRRTTVCTI